MKHKLTEELIRSLPFSSPTTRDTEVRGLMVICNAQSKSYCIQTDLWRNKRKVKCIRITLGRTDRLSLRVARSRARELMAAISRGEDPRAPSSVTAWTLLEMWALYQRAGHLSPKTRQEYGGHVTRYLKPIHAMPLVELGENRRLIRELHERLTVKHGPYAANHAMRTLRALYNHGLREDSSLPPNPVIAVTFNKEGRRNWAIPKDNLPGWWATVQKQAPIIRDLHLVLLFTGLRRTDACTIKGTNIDWEKGSLYVPNPKGGKDRAFTLPLSEFLLQVCRERMNDNAILFPESSWLFPSSSKSGHVVEPKKPGLPAAHAYRHTYRTLALEAGIPYDETCLLLNHKRRDVSYGYISPGALFNHLKIQQERLTTFLLSAIKPINQLAS